MNAVNFEQANVTYVGEGCVDLPVSQSVNSEFKCLNLVSCWEPTDEEMDYIKQCISNGEKPKFYLNVLGNAQPPVWIGCNLYEEGEDNGQ